MHYGIAFTTTAKRRYLTFWNSLCVGKAATWFWDRAIVSLAASDTRWARLRLSLKCNLAQKRKEKPHWFFLLILLFWWLNVTNSSQNMSSHDKFSTKKLFKWMWFMTDIIDYISECQSVIPNLWSKIIGLQNGSQLTSISSNFYSNLVCFACDTVWGHAPH